MPHLTQLQIQVIVELNTYWYIDRPHTTNIMYTPV